LFFRVTLDRSGIFVASWLRNYRVRDELIEAVLVAKYSGAITRFRWRPAVWMLLLLSSGF